MKIHLSLLLLLTASSTALGSNSTNDSSTDNSTLPPNACSLLEPGDLQVVIMNTDPLDQLVFLPLADIDEAIQKLYVTDRAWDGNSSFVTDEGTLVYTMAGDIRASQVFGFGVQYPDDKGSWDYLDAFDLSSSFGDNILVYCLDAYEEPHFLSALTYNGAFSEPNLVEYTASETARPIELENVGSVALPFSPNYLYQGPDQGRKDELLAAFQNPANYVGSDLPYTVSTETSAAGAGLNAASKGILTAFVLFGTWMVVFV